jgi:DNA replication protein DnaC
MARRTPPIDPDTIIERLKRHLELLGLRHTLERLDEHLAWARSEQPSASALLERVLGEVAAHKLERRIERRIKYSGLPERKTLEAFDFNFQPGLDKALVVELAQLDFARRREDLVITGQCGTGKSHILKALALRGCQQQMRVRYARCVDLVDDLYAGLADDTYPQRLKRWASVELLIIDDVGLGQLRKRDGEPTAAHMLFNLTDRRHGACSTALSSNIKLSSWGKYLSDATLAAAILDRLTMSAIRIDIKGPSYRDEIAKQRAKERAERRRKPPARSRTQPHKRKPPTKS